MDTYKQTAIIKTLKQNQFISKVLVGLAIVLVMVLGVVLMVVSKWI